MEVSCMVGTTISREKITKVKMGFCDIFTPLVFVHVLVPQRSGL